jgi:ribosomal protein S18 acetylase RimI-like enzyme
MNQSSGGFQTLRAGPEHIELLAPLFDAYRRFYRLPEDSVRARAYLAERLSKGESVVFIALAEGSGAPEALGFTQLYPSFGSLAMKRVWILYDLYVVPLARRRGVAKALMEEARKLASETGADTLVLETAIDNTSAQKLYEQLGYKRDNAFYRYALQI